VGNGSLSLYGVKLASVTAEGIGFEGPGSEPGERLWISAHGSVTFTIPGGGEHSSLPDLLVPPKPATLTHGPSPEAENMALPSASRPTSPPAAPEAGSEPLQSPTGPSPEGRKTDYIRLSGRVGRTPVFWTTRNGVPIAKFP